MATYVSIPESQHGTAGYLNQFSDAISRQDGATLRPLLVVSSPDPLLPSGDVLSNFTDSRLVTQSDQMVQFSEILLPLLRSIQSHRLSRFVEAYSSYEKAANAFLQEFANWKTPWAMEAMHTVALEIRLLAEKADQELASSGKMPEKLQGAGSFLVKVFGALARKGSKRVGALYITCQLFKIHFKLGTVDLCHSVIGAVETSGIFDFEEFPLKDKVTYMYFTGRLEVFNENFVAADQRLTYALESSDPQNKSNIRLILKFLVPVKLSIGILPEMSLLKEYDLMEYTGIVDALKTGDIRLLRQALQEHEERKQQRLCSLQGIQLEILVILHDSPPQLLLDQRSLSFVLHDGAICRFLRSSIYLVLEKLDLLVYQRLLQRIYTIQKQNNPDKAHHIKLDTAMNELKWLGVDMDSDEGECTIRMLIYKNLLKGYFAHKSKVCVLSKSDPFPGLCERPLMAS